MSQAGISTVPDSEPIVCTIITANRIAFARTLARSFLDHHPTGRCFALVVDRFDGLIEPAEEPLEVLSLDALQIPELDSFRFKYTPFELCCALKPFLLRHLLENRGCNKAVYLDSDIMVLAPLDPVDRCLDDHDIVLTPHLDRDLPDDGKKPDDAHVMLSGVFNAGFIGVKNSVKGMGFLEWWQGKLQNRCIEDHFNGRFVDQKYLDLVTGLFESVGVLRHPGCNTAYWNLHSRTINREGESWLANGEPLVFYHFSDYRLDRPGEISGHQDRFSFDQLPDLRVLFDHYRSCVLANEDEICRKWDYSYGVYRNGKKIRPWTRRAFLLTDQGKRGFDPFDSSKHPAGFRLRSVRQGLLMLLNRIVHKFLRKP